MKSRVYRILALTIIFNGNMELLMQWILEMQQRLLEHGLDTPAYLPDPANPTVMLLVTSAYPKFTLQCARKCMKEAQKHWDTYTHNNNKDAMALLKNSITPALDRKLFERRLDGDTTFAVVLILLLQLNQSNSVHRYNLLKDQLRQLRLQQFPGQNVITFIVKARALYKELFAANQYDELITRDVVNNLMQGGGGHQRRRLRPGQATSPGGFRCIASI